MPLFQFDESASFEVNLEAFIDAMADDDSEMAEVFRSHATKLIGASDDNQRRAARTSFNQAIKASLDATLNHDESGEST